MGVLQRDAGVRAALVSLFIVSMFSISFETFLTRYFAVALFSQYSYWIISIAMLGYSVSGVLLALRPGFFERRRALVLLLVPLLLIGLSALAYAVLRADPFNPLELQNGTLWAGQLLYVVLYYLALFPVFFLAGTFVGLNFLVFHRQIGRLYAVDLLGAAAGAMTVLALMLVLHPYHLPVVMFGLLALASLLTARQYFGSLKDPRAVATVAVAVCAAGLASFLVLSVSPLSVPPFKALHGILNIAGASVERSILSPSGHYLVVDDYTERDDLAMTNNYGLLKIAGPPRSRGLYVDGQRTAPLLARLPQDLSYVRGSLPYFPYVIRREPRVLLVGTNGGYRIPESAAGGARQIVALEPQRIVYRLVDAALRRQDPGYRSTYHAELVRGSVFSVLRGQPGRFDIIEVASDYLGQADNSRYAFTREAAVTYLRSLAPGGILSIPVDVSRLDVFAFKTFNTLRAAFQELGLGDLSAHLLVYRTVWICQFLASNRPFTAEEIGRFKAFCAQRSFDTPFYPGIDPASVTVWNDLPPVSFAAGSAPRSGSPQDAIMTELVAALKTPAASSVESRYFDLRPSTLDRPDFYAISRLGRFFDLLSHVSFLPVQEVGYLLNAVVLVQSILLGAVVLLLPALLLRRAFRSGRTGSALLARTVLYFAALGFGYLFVELALIAKFSLFLGSATTSFGVILSTMLVFSGLGSLSSHRMRQEPFRGLAASVPVIAAGLLFVAFVLDPLLSVALGAPGAFRPAIAVAVSAPIAFAMGRPFPLGNNAVGGRAANLVPWAWAVNGGVSVVATPLASILSTTVGWTLVLFAALVLYLLSLPLFPGVRALRARREREA